jgi:hypothetical protein
MKEERKETLIERFEDLKVTDFVRVVCGCGENHFVILIRQHDPELYEHMFTGEIRMVRTFATDWIPVTHGGISNVNNNPYRITEFGVEQKRIFRIDTGLKDEQEHETARPNKIRAALLDQLVRRR